MKRYKTYKTTDQSWLTNVPKHWGYVKCKTLFATQTEKNKNNEEGNILSLTLQGVVRNNREKPIGLSPSDYRTYQIFEKDDLVFKLIDLENISTSRVGLVPERGIMSSAYIRLSAKCDINTRFFYFQYYDLWLRQIFNGLGAGVRQTLSANDLLNIKIVVPPRDEQDQIVRYLDSKISAIDAGISKLEEQIKCLKELKSTLISDVVTGKIDVRDAEIPTNPSME